MDSWIIYDTGAKSGDGNHTFKDEAEIRQKQLSEKYGTPVHLIGVSNAKDFQTNWNNKVGYDSDGNSISIDEVVIIAHGSIAGSQGNGTGFMYFESGSRIAAKREAVRNSSTDITVSSLSEKTIKHLYFSSCNTAHEDAYNIVYAFMQITSYTHITGWDGGTIFNYDTNTLEPGGYGSNWIQEARRQPTWYKFVPKDYYLVPTRTRTGKREFWGLGDYVSGGNYA